MLRHVALVRTDLSEERGASTIRVTRICELGTTLGITSNDAGCEDLLEAPRYSDSNKNEHQKQK
jgi:hypothetical protein